MTALHMQTRQSQDYSLIRASTCRSERTGCTFRYDGRKVTPASQAMELVKDKVEYSHLTVSGRLSHALFVC